MARAHVRYTVQDRAGNAIQGAQVTFYLTGTSTLLTDLYTVATAGTPVTLATLLSNNQGEVEGWVDTPKTIDVQVSDNSHTAFYSGSTGSLLTFAPFTETVEVLPPPEDIATQSGSNTFTGTNTFITDPVYAGPAGTPLHQATPENVTGVKTFVADPVFNDGAIPQSKVAGLSGGLVDLASDQTITGKKYFKGPFFWDIEAYGAIPTLTDATTKANNAIARQNAINAAAAGGGKVRTGPGVWHFSDYADWSAAPSVQVVGVGNPGGLNGSIWREWGTYNGRVLTATCIVEFTGTTHTNTTIDGLLPPLSSADVNRPVTGTGIPPSTTISAVGGGGTSATLSQAATASATVTLTLAGPYNVHLGDTSATSGDAGSSWRGPGSGLFAFPYASLLNGSGAQGPAADVKAVSSKQLSATGFPGTSTAAYTYDGVNTITAKANGAYATADWDGVTLAVNDRVLFKNGGTSLVVSAAENGVYKLTQAGDGSNPWIFTRDSDTLSTGLAVNCLAGNKYFNSLWYFTGTTGHWARSQGQTNYVESYVDSSTLTLKFAVQHTFYNQKGCQLGLAHHRIRSVTGGISIDNMRIEVGDLTGFYGDIISGWIAGNNSWGPFRITDSYLGVPSGSTTPGKFLSCLNLCLAIGTKINVHTDGGRHGVVLNNHVNELNACKWEQHVGPAIVGGAQTTNINGGYLEALSGQDPAMLLDWDGVFQSSSETNIRGVWGADGIAGVTESSWCRFAGAQLNVEGGHMATSDYGVTIAGATGSRLTVTGTNGNGLGAGVQFLLAQTGVANKVQSAVLLSCGFPTTALVNASTNCLSGWAFGNANLTDGSFGFAPSVLTLVNALTLSGAVTLSEGINLILGTATGTKIGTSTAQLLSFWNATPIARPSAFTQTYSTATKTHSNPTSVILTDNSGGTDASPTIAAIAGGGVGATAATVASVSNAVATLAAQVNALRVDLLNAKQVLNAAIDDDQAVGLKG